jgi:hypothetical protein
MLEIVFLDNERERSSIHRLNPQLLHLLIQRIPIDPQKIRRSYNRKLWIGD